MPRPRRPILRDDSYVHYSLDDRNAAEQHRRLLLESDSQVVLDRLGPMIAPPEDTNPRQRAMAVWRDHPHVLLFLAPNISSSYSDFLGSGTIGIGQVNFVNETIQADRRSHCEAPAQQWEATQIPNGIYVGISPGGRAQHRYRVRTATQGSEAVRGRRIVQHYRPSGWKSFAYLTREGTLRLWQSQLADARAGYVTAAFRLFDGSTLRPVERHCWLCNTVSVGGHEGDEPDPSEDCGLCASHINALPRPPRPTRQPRFNAYGEALYVPADDDDRDEDEEEEEEDDDYDEEPVPLASSRRRRAAVVHAEMSEINPEWVR